MAKRLAKIDAAVAKMFLFLVPKNTECDFSNHATEESGSFDPDDIIMAFFIIIIIILESSLNRNKDNLCFHGISMYFF